MKFRYFSERDKSLGYILTAASAAMGLQLCASNILMDLPWD